MVGRWTATDSCARIRVHSPFRARRHSHEKLYCRWSCLVNRKPCSCCDPNHHEHIRAFNNKAYGIAVTWYEDFNIGAAHRVIGNIAYSNGIFGIAVTCPSVVLENMAYQNNNNATGYQIFEDGGNCTSANNNPAP